MLAGLFFALAPDTQKPRKNIGFLWFSLIAHVTHKAKNDVKSLPELAEQGFPQKCRSNLVLKLVEHGFGRVGGTFGCLLAGFAALLGGSWLRLGSSGPALDAS